MIKRNSYKTATMASVMALTIWLVGCEKTPEAQQTGVVAKVGSFEISDKHFTNHLKRFYLRTGQAANINEDFRLAVINSRIERYSIVEYARDMGWAHDTDAMHNKAMIERKVYMEEYQRRFIYDRVVVTDDHLREVFRRYNTTIRASHLFARNRTEADSLYMLLQNGADFHQLAKENFGNPQLALTGGDLGYFTLDEMDIAFEEKAYRMQIGEISEPVRTSRGYSIIKVTDIINKPIVTEYQFAERKNAIAPVARDQQNELATRRDMEVVLGSMTRNEHIYGILWELVQANSDAYRTSVSELKELPLPVGEELRDQVIARSGSFTFTVQDFLVEAFYTPAERRGLAQDFHAFQDQVEGLIYRKYALGLVHNLKDLDKDFLSGSIEETFYGYLFGRFESYIDSKVKVDDSLVRSTYNSDPSLFSQPLMLNMAELVLTDRSTADDIYELLLAGADFNEMLEKHGAATYSKEQGGELGFFPIDRFGVMSTSLRNVQKGELAGPFQVASNYYIILKCLGREDSRDMSFEEAEPTVREYLFTSVRNKLRDELVLKLRSQYNATIDMKRLNSLSFQL
jgi:parvulin-like peptidyl-prolyl isomerase